MIYTEVAQIKWEANFQRWLGTKTNNIWLQYKDARVYLRRSLLMVDGTKHKLLVLATITRASRAMNVMIDPTVRRTGFMDEFMDVLEVDAKQVGDGIMVENVLNEFLPGYLRRRGYTEQSHAFGLSVNCPSYYLLCNV